MFWRVRNCSVGYYATGLGCMVAEDNILGQNKDKFNIANISYGNQPAMWITKDFSNSKLHRWIRIKTFSILMNNTPRELLHLHPTEWGTYTTRPNLESHYKVEFESNEYKEIEYEAFDFQICKPNINPLADSLVNEVWPLLRIFYKTRGAYSIEIDFDPETDKQEFSRFLGDNMKAKIKFKIDNDGNWDADFTFDYKQLPNNWVHEPYQNIESNALKRILILSDNENNIQYISPEEGNRIAQEHNKNVDFSFDYHYKDSGKW
jgi:hypothetical protein